MEWVWVIKVCATLIISIDAQDAPSTSPTYLISAPRILHPGVPTSLPVTIITNSPLIVTAEVLDGNTSIVQTEGTFPGGVTELLVLPPIVDMPEGQERQYTLEVRGREGSRVVFSNATSLTLRHRRFATFIQTDKSNYRPGQTVKVRVLSIYPDGKPHKGRADIAIRNPAGNMTRHWLSLDSDLGVVSREFQLSPDPPLGLWVAEAVVNGLVSIRQFTVDHSVEPSSFHVSVTTSTEVLLGSSITGTVDAQHSRGGPVQGVLTVVATLVSTLLYPSSQPWVMNKTKEIHGSAPFVFSEDDLPELDQFRSPAPDGSMRHRDENIVIYVTACVTQFSTGFKSTKTVAVNVAVNMYHLEFSNHPLALKPSLNFTTQLKISRYNKNPLTLPERMNSVRVEVTQRKSGGQEHEELGPQGHDSDVQRTVATQTMTLAVPEDGTIPIQFRLQDQVEMLFIQAEFLSVTNTLEVHTTRASPSGSYIQIHPASLPAQVGIPIHLITESTHPFTELQYVVTSRGQVVAAGRETAASFSLIPTESWAPTACVAVFHILPGGEIVNDATRIPLDRVLGNNVSLSWGHERERPGDEVPLRGSVSEPGSLVVDGGAEGLESDGDITEEGVLGGFAEYITEEMILPHGDMVKEDPLSVSTVCNLVVLTDAILPQVGDTMVLDSVQAEAGVRDEHWAGRKPTGGEEFTETWLWRDTNVSDSTATSLHLAAPDPAASWSSTASVTSDNLGLGLSSISNRLTAFKDLSLSLNLPTCIVRGEELVLEINLFNRLQQGMEVVVVVADSESFEFVLAHNDDVSPANTQTVSVRSQGGASVLFPIRPLVHGEITISVNAVSSSVASDYIVEKVLVKPEGIEQSFSQALFLDIAPTERSLSREMRLSFPPGVVPGSQRAHVAVVGDILGPSITGLESLVQMPYGCGEQNMIRFAPSVYVLQYLSKSSRPNEDIQSKALSFMRDGYQRELSYLRDDGSFSAFGASDTSGSTWLTAFVLRCFLQAQPFMQVDPSVISRALSWLVGQQAPQGNFNEPGRVIHTELRGGLGGSVALTAYVLVALLEDQAYTGMFPDTVSKAQAFLEGRMASGISSNYSLCLVAYALSLANSPVAHSALAELRSRADMRDGVMSWSMGSDLTDSWQPSSAAVEGAAYVLLALYKQASVVEGIALMKWLSQQRSHLGGYGSTQDTVIALQALSCYAAFSGADAIDLSIEVSSTTSRIDSNFKIDSTNYLVNQRQEIEAGNDLSIDVFMEGRGFALFQMDVFYHLENSVLSRRQRDGTAQEAFALNVEVFDDENDLDHVHLSICTNLLENQRVVQTGMVLMDVKTLTGFTLAREGMETDDVVRKVEIFHGRVVLYLDSLTTAEVCLQIPMEREYKVARVQQAAVQVYDYYEPRRRAVRIYHSEVMRDMSSNAFCGQYYSLCGAKNTISHSTEIHSANSSIYRRGWLLATAIALIWQ